jgi:hypothetical protein
MGPAIVPVHLGDLHAYETALLALLAFGPFVVLGFVVVMMRRRDVAEEEDGPREDRGSARAHEVRRER